MPGPIIVKQLAFVDIPWNATELDGLRMRITNSVAALRHSNEQLREAIAEGDDDPEFVTAIAENVEIISSRELRIAQLTAILDTLKAAGEAGRPVHFVHEAEWANVAADDNEMHSVVIGLDDGSPGSAAAAVAPGPGQAVDSASSSTLEAAAVAMGMDL